MATIRVLESLLFIAASASASLAAQIPIDVGLQVDATEVRVGGLSPEVATGTLLGGRGSALLGPVRLAVVYREGRVRVGSGRPLLVEGWAAADVQILPWLTVGMGPAARAYQLDSATLRREWLAGRVGLDAPLIGKAVRVDLRLWRSLLTSATNADLTRVDGGEVGIAYWGPSNVWIRLATTFDETVFPGRHERLSGLSLGVGIGR